MSLWGRIRRWWSGSGGSEATPDAPSPDGYWDVKEWKGPPKDIYFRWLRQGCPPELHALKSDIERTLIALRIIYLAKAEEMERKAQRSWLQHKRQHHEAQAQALRSRFDEAFTKLLYLARLGLNGKEPAVAEARAALLMLHAETLDQEGGRIKNDYMRRLGVCALVLALPLAALFVLFEAVPGLAIDLVQRNRTLLLVFASCAIGAWASFASRKVVLNFQDLANLEDDRLNPWMRLAFTNAMTGFLTLVLVTGMAAVSVGSFDSADLLGSPATALLIGSLAGLAEKALPSAMLQRAQSLLAAPRPA